MKVHRRDDWLAAKVGDELVMMSVATGRYIGLNDVGARIWDLLATPCDVETLCSGLEEEYDVEPDQCRVEVDAFVAELVKHGAVAFDPG